jgi:HK97 family phage major capsid protein
MTLTNEQRAKRVALYNYKLPGSELSTVAAKRKEMVESYMRESNGDVIAALSLSLMEDTNLRKELNRSLLNTSANKRDSNIRLIGFESESKLLEEAEELTRASGVYETITPASAGVLVQTNVADFIATRIEELGQIRKLTSNFFDIQQGKGNFTLPRRSNSPIATFGVETSYLNNINQDLDSVNLTTSQYGAYVGMSLLFQEKINGSNLRFIMDMLAEAMYRAEERGILSGTGLNGNPTGLLQNATAITAGANIFDTITNAVAQLSQKKVQRDKLTIVFNGAVYAVVEKASRSGNNNANFASLDLVNNKISGIPFVITENLDSVGSAGSQVAPLVIGDFSSYYFASNGGYRTDTDNFTGFTNLTTKTRIYSFATGIPTWTDSFAKINVTTGL